jgi:hypothetical protein
MQIWDLWYPKAAATGMPFARGRIDGADELLVHAAPDYLTVHVRDDKGVLLAEGIDLPATDETPIALLTRQGNTITRQDLFPTSAHIGKLVILPGGEVGTLTAWWNAEDRSEWRWQIELYNRKG